VPTICSSLFQKQVYDGCSAFDHPTSEKNARLVGCQAPKTLSIIPYPESSYHPQMFGGMLSALFSTGALVTCGMPIESELDVAVARVVLEAVISRYRDCSRAMKLRSIMETAYISSKQDQKLRRQTTKTSERLTVSF
jgi:hypothetical protein